MCAMAYNDKRVGGDMLSTTAVVQLVDVVNFDVYSLVRL